MKWTKLDPSLQAKESTNKQEKPLFSKEELGEGRDVDPLRIAAFKMLIAGLTEKHRDEMLLQLFPMMEDVAEIIALFLDWAESELTIRGENGSPNARDLKLREIVDRFTEVMGERDDGGNWGESPSKAFIKALKELHDGGDIDEVSAKYIGN